MQESPPLEVYLAPPVLWSRPKESETLWRPDPSLAQPLPIKYNMSSQSSSLPRLELLEMLMILRRKFLSDAIKFAGSPLILSPYASLPQESREHIERAMIHSSYVDDEVIDDLSAITQRYWNMRKKTAGIALLGAVGDFRRKHHVLPTEMPMKMYFPT